MHVAQAEQKVEMRLRHPAYQALLSQELLSGIALRSMGAYQLGWLEGLAQAPNQAV